MKIEPENCIGFKAAVNEERRREFNRKIAALMKEYGVQYIDADDSDIVDDQSSGASSAN